jgi:hypothetical protein
MNATNNKARKPIKRSGLRFCVDVFITFPAIPVPSLFFGAVGLKVEKFI